MSSRRFRRIALAVVIMGTVSLAPPPAEAREIGWRDFGGVTRQLRGFLHRLFELSRGGMDPNGSPGGGG